MIKITYYSFLTIFFMIRQLFDFASSIAVTLPEIFYDNHHHKK